MDLKGNKKIGIIGVGFMGGSLALALKKKFKDFEVIGYARNKQSLTRLKKAKILDKIEKSYQEIANQADILILATPVGVIIDLLKKIGPYLREGAIVIDLGSTKGEIEKSAKRYLPKKVYFVGCHPFCGSEKKGVEQAREGLYQKSLCFITSKNKATALISKMWEKIGSRVVQVSPKAHDQITCLVSHLPHLICFSLLNMISDNYLKFSSSGFYDLTRIGSSADGLWADIFLTNKEKLLNNIDKYNQEIENFKAAIKKEDKKKLKVLIKKANQKRSKMI